MIGGRGNWLPTQHETADTIVTSKALAGMSCAYGSMKTRTKRFGASRTSFELLAGPGLDGQNVRTTAAGRARHKGEFVGSLS